MTGRVLIFKDRDGDELTIAPRNITGNRVPDPIITITKHVHTTSENSCSVVLLEEDVPGIIFEMVLALNLTPLQIRELILSLGSILAE